MYEVTVAWIWRGGLRRVEPVLTTPTLAPSLAALSINCLTMISRPVLEHPEQDDEQQVNDDGGLDGGVSAAPGPGRQGSGGHGGRPASV